MNAKLTEISLSLLSYLSFKIECEKEKKPFKTLLLLSSHHHAPLPYLPLQMQMLITHRWQYHRETRSPRQPFPPSPLPLVTLTATAVGIQPSRGSQLPHGDLLNYVSCSASCTDIAIPQGPPCGKVLPCIVPQPPCRASTYTPSARCHPPQASPVRSKKRHVRHRHSSSSSENKGSDTATCDSDQPDPWAKTKLQATQAGEWQLAQKFSAFPVTYKKGRRAGTTNRTEWEAFNSKQITII